MIMPCLTRAIQASGIAFVICAIASCGGGAGPVRAGTAQFAASSSGTAPDKQDVPVQEGDDAALRDAQTDRMMQPTMVEQYHFNAYKKFSAMLDAASDQHGQRSRPELEGAGDADNVCARDSLIRQDD